MFYFAPVFGGSIRFGQELRGREFMRVVLCLHAWRQKRRRLCLWRKGPEAVLSFLPPPAAPRAYLADRRPFAAGRCLPLL